MLFIFGVADPGDARFNCPGKVLHLFWLRNSSILLLLWQILASTSRWDLRGGLGRSETLESMTKLQPLLLVHRSHLPIQISFQVARNISSQSFVPITPLLPREGRWKLSLFRAVERFRLVLEDKRNLLLTHLRSISICTIKCSTQIYLQWLSGRVEVVCCRRKKVAGLINVENRSLCRTLA